MYDVVNANLTDLMKGIIRILRKVVNRLKAMQFVFLLGVLLRYTVNKCLSGNNTNESIDL